MQIVLQLNDIKELQYTKDVLLPALIALHYHRDENKPQKSVAATPEPNAQASLVAKDVQKMLADYGREKGVVALKMILDKLQIQRVSELQDGPKTQEAFTLVTGEL